MRRSQIDAILVEQTERRNNIISFICVIFVITLLSFALFFVFFKSDNKNYVTYSEKSNIDYKVFLKENDFFENEYLGKNKQYIASLIDYINANFEYKLAFDSNNIDYKYEYRVVANVNVYDKETNNVIFNKNEELVPKIMNTTSDREVLIKKSINIDYNHFNNLITKFVSVYDLEEVESVLSIDMYINTVGSCEDFAENKENESVITLSIPLTTKTMAIEISDDLIDTENNVMLCETSNVNYVILMFAILTLIIDIILMICLIKYEIKTRTAVDIYSKKLKKILNNYGAYIQEVADNLVLKGYQSVKLKTFEDLLEIRDTIKQPILMSQNEEKKCTYFVIPSNAKYLYMYRLKIEDIEVEIIK